MKFKNIITIYIIFVSLKGNAYLRHTSNSQLYCYGNPPDIYNEFCKVPISKEEFCHGDAIGDDNYAFKAPDPVNITCQYNLKASDFKDRLNCETDGKDDWLMLNIRIIYKGSKHYKLMKVSDMIKTYDIKSISENSEECQKLVTNDCGCRTSTVSEQLIPLFRDYNPNRY